MKDQLDIRPLSDRTRADFLETVNAYLAGWPYTRTIDTELLLHWESLETYQPENIIILYEKNQPVVALHGELQRDGGAIVHLLAVGSGHSEAGEGMLDHFEANARREGHSNLIGPHWGSARFYGGYILGNEPYHPHWGVDATEAYIRSGWRITHPGVIMVRELSDPVEEESDPAGYAIIEVNREPEYGASAFGFHAEKDGREAAHCYARWYPHVEGRDGGRVGQIGNVNTEEPHRSRGLARIMVKRSLLRLREFGAREALISTGLSNLPALRAYENAGFHRCHNINEWSKSLRNPYKRSK